MLHRLVFGVLTALSCCMLRGGRGHGRRGRRAVRLRDGGGDVSDRGPGSWLLRTALLCALSSSIACTSLQDGDENQAGGDGGGMRSDAGGSGKRDARVPDPPSRSDAGTRTPDATTADSGGQDAAADAAPGCVPHRYFSDADGDGHGDPGKPVEACEQPAQTSTSSDDCDDGCADCYPGGSESCDGVRDENCSTAVDEGCACSIGGSRGCGEDRGVCELGSQSCGDDGTWSASCTGGRGPEPSELCGNALDDDCDGMQDEAPGPGLCCVDEHCDASQRCAAGGTCVAKTWCELRTVPAGVAAADYQCLDFDVGLPGAPWTQSNAGEGVLMTSTTQASSAPNSLFASTGRDDGSDTHALRATSTGAAAITSISIAADIYPRVIEGLYQPWDPTVTAQVLCVSPASRRYCLSYIIGDHPDHVGLVFEQWAFDGGVSFLTCPVLMDPAEGVWSRVELRVATGTDPQVLVNGSVRATADCNMRMGPGTSTTAQVGMVNNGKAGWSIYIDNTELVVSR
jgi:hypothetical protein